MPVESIDDLAVVQMQKKIERMERQLNRLKTINTYRDNSPVDVFANLPALQGAWCHNHAIAYDARPQIYTPVWTSTGTQPSLGDGTLQGRFVLNGYLCIASVRFEFGSTTTGGTGYWEFSLPLDCGGQGMETQYIGVAHLYDYSAGVSYEKNVFVLPASWAGKVRYFIDQDQNTAVTQLSATSPFTWDDGDDITFSIAYEVHNGYGGLV